MLVGPSVSLPFGESRRTTLSLVQTRRARCLAFVSRVKALSARFGGRRTCEPSTNVRRSVHGLRPAGQVHGFGANAATITPAKDSHQPHKQRCAEEQDHRAPKCGSQDLPEPAAEPAPLAAPEAGAARPELAPAAAAPEPRVRAAARSALRLRASFFLVAISRYRRSR